MAPAVPVKSVSLFGWLLLTAIAAALSAWVSHYITKRLEANENQ